MVLRRDDVRVGARRVARRVDSAAVNADPALVAVDAPVPGFAGEVVEAVRRAVAGEPLVGGIAVGADHAPVPHEVDGETLLVHRRSREGRRWVTAVR